LFCACGSRELTQQERFDLYLQTLQGDSTGYRIEYVMAASMDTLYGVYNLSLPYIPLKKQLDQYDSLTILFLARRDSTFQRKYVPSIDKERSTYLNWNRFNDSAKLYHEKSIALRQKIEREAIRHNKKVKGYIIDFRVDLIGKGDTIVAHQFDIWLKQDFPIEGLKYERIRAL
jgi:hypothetical protein